MTRRRESANRRFSRVRRWPDSDEVDMNAIAVVPDDSSACPRPARLLAAACLMPGLLCPAGVFAAETPQPTPTSSLEEHVQVTATRIPEKTGTTPVSITVITRDDLIRRGAY